MTTDSREIPPPRTLSKAEKEVFRRIILIRKLAGNPVSAAEIDTVVDYAASRSRVEALRSLLQRTNPDVEAGFFLAVSRRIDAAEAASQRLRKALQLIIPGQPKN
jgi:hypothetical protein